MNVLIDIFKEFCCFIVKVFKKCELKLMVVISIEYEVRYNLFKMLNDNVL